MLQRELTAKQLKQEIIETLCNNHELIKLKNLKYYELIKIPTLDQLLEKLLSLVESLNVEDFYSEYQIQVKKQVHKSLAYYWKLLLHRIFPKYFQPQQDTQPTVVYSDQTSILYDFINSLLDCTSYINEYYSSIQDSPENTQNLLKKYLHLAEISKEKYLEIANHLEDQNAHTLQDLDATRYLIELMFKRIKDRLEEEKNINEEQNVKEEAIAELSKSVEKMLNQYFHYQKSGKQTISVNDRSDVENFYSQGKLQVSDKCYSHEAVLKALQDIKNNSNNSNTVRAYAQYYLERPSCAKDVIAKQYGIAGTSLNTNVKKELFRKLCINLKIPRWQENHNK
jgi:hypothetical protein